MLLKNGSHCTVISGSIISRIGVFTVDPIEEYFKVPFQVKRPGRILAKEPLQELILLIRPSAVLAFRIALLFRYFPCIT
jgi:hypothetical protein